MKIMVIFLDDNERVLSEGICKVPKDFLKIEKFYKRKHDQAVRQDFRNELKAVDKLA